MDSIRDFSMCAGERRVKSSHSCLNRQDLKDLKDFPFLGGLGGLRGLLATGGAIFELFNYMS